MEAVIDTNIIVSGLLFPDNNPGKILEMVATGQITPVYDNRILREYQSVLSRDKFKINPSYISDFLSLLEIKGRYVFPIQTNIGLPDETDRCFYECALFSESKILVTGNKKHFPLKLCLPVQAHSPREFIDLFFAR
jgi:putative PIN family toxin of toxin-antitoxin system